MINARNFAGYLEEKASPEQAVRVGHLYVSIIGATLSGDKWAVHKVLEDTVCFLTGRGDRIVGVV